MSALAPIAPGLWTDETEPRLIGGRRADGEIVFPVPEGDAAALVEPVALSRRGTLWSWTTQGFEPKEPYSGPQPF
ncbi:MAG TPA: DNA-binding protein, partial [Sphingopyxis sp.]|nr:DNA-binding protein [Sphingopyxis sp.]